MQDWETQGFSVIDPDELEVLSQHALDSKNQ
jgi:hypothetical protein